MQDMIDFLVNNPDVVEKVRQGAASLVGLSEVEVKAILDVFSNSTIYSSIAFIGYWN